MKDGPTWWEEWFLDIAKWKEWDVDSSRAVWMDVYGIPALAWNTEFCDASQFIRFFHRY